MRNKIITICILSVVIVATLIYTINVNQEKDSKFNIVTSFYPIHVAVLNITDGVGEMTVTNLTQETTGCIHDYVLTTSELVALAKADTLVVNGAGMEGFMDKVISNFEDLDIIDASKGIETIHSECENHTEEHEGHNHEINPHIFVSVKNYIKQVQNICDELVKLDNANKEKYEENTREYIQLLEELDGEILQIINDLENKNIITFHNTFEYFAKDYGLNVIGTIENEHGRTPSAGEIAELVGKINNNDVKAIFVEPDYSMKIVDTISKETGIKVYVLNPVTSGEKNKDEYISIMRENLEVLKEALS